MPSNLRRAVKSTVASFLRGRLESDGDIASDVYRALRDEAHLLLEAQLVCDALDSDPFELTRVSQPASEKQELGGCNEDGDNGPGDFSEKRKNAELIARVKEILRVISCTRIATLDGYSSIRAVVQLDYDCKMKGVKDNVRLHFTFLRHPQHDIEKDDGGEHEEVFYADADDYFNDEEWSSSDGNGEPGESGSVNKMKSEGQPNRKRKKMAAEADASADDKDETDDDDVISSGSSVQSNGKENSKKFTPKTIVTYKIDFSIDYGKMEPLFGVDVYSFGDNPSVDEAIPIMDDFGIVAVDDNSVNSSGNDKDAKDFDEGDSCHDATRSKEKGSNTKETQLGDACRRSESKTKNIKQVPPSNEDEVERTEIPEGVNPQRKDVNTRSGTEDQFGVSVNPENVAAFLDRVNLDFNEQSVFYFLLTFPFYEHEWDIAGFLLASLFDEEDSSIDEADEGCLGNLPDFITRK